MAGHRRNKSSTSQKLRSVFSFSRDKPIVQAVKVVDPADEEAAIQAQRQLAVAVFLANERRAFAAGKDISRANTCPDLTALDLSARRQGPSHALKITLPNESAPPPVDTPTFSIKESPDRPRTGEPALQHSASWSLFRSHWSFKSEDKERGLNGSVVLEIPDQPDGLCESPGLLAPDFTPSQSFFSIGSRHHSRANSGSRLNTPDSTSPISGRSGSSFTEASLRSASSEVNLNRRFESGRAPVWYKREPVESSLCANCKRIDFEALYAQEPVEILPPPRDFIVMGTLLGLMTRKSCGFCQLAARVISNDATHASPAEDIAATLLGLLEETYYLCPARLGRSELHLFSSKDVKESSAPRRTMAIRPLENGIQDAPSGRLLRSPKDMDFDWIRQRLRECEDCDTVTHRDIDIQAIDVQKMCIVDLAEDDSYVTLSHVQQDQLELPALRHPNSLLNCWDDLPPTIQDAIKLVREIGQRYLWVDALCQGGETGRIFQGSTLTICACASQGLPGVEVPRTNSRQAVEMIDSHLLGSIFRGASCENYGVAQSLWGTRADTLQEQALSRRRLLVTDECVTWCCSHGQVVEDENGGCEMAASTHVLVNLSKEEPENQSNMDIFARIVSEYTRRDLPDPREAENAVVGLLRHLEPAFKGVFLSGLPDTEFSAGLLWSPLGATTRRVDPETSEPLFPSWSWLGWTGQAVYPWLTERTMPMSEDPGSPLLWKNMAPEIDDPHDQWFTGDDYRGMPQPGSWSDDGWTHLDDTGRWLHPVLDVPESGRPHQFGHERLHFRTLSAQFQLEQKVRVRGRPFGEQEVHVVRVLNERGFAVGYIYADAVPGKQREFVVLSRASTRDPRVGLEQLHATPLSELSRMYSMDYLVGGIQRLRPVGDATVGGMPVVDELGHFDTRLYDASTPWGLFNVMMIEWKTVEGVKVAERVAIGRIHVAAFMDAWPVDKDIVLV